MKVELLKKKINDYCFTFNHQQVGKPLYFIFKVVGARGIPANFETVSLKIEAIFESLELKNKLKSHLIIFL